MSDQFVSKLRFYWDDADHALERWLEDMARQGLHLHKVQWVRCRFVFKRGAPAEMAYRLDFQTKRVAPDYVQLFADAGWERVDYYLGWQFWRAPARAGRPTEIFTDTESHIRKYQRLLWLFALVWLIFFLALFRRGATLWDSPADIALMLAVVFFNLYPVVRLVLRIRRLRNRTP
ncbi:DUF2812 domain-containing protein [Massilia sp. Leaf139]|uniref:DUF2812 domain-containing protein n=1 Tax=Massilia sp. Leaf139 TaxID=1736272 RepID=UPI0006F8847B|nr:DUF2812 domain-containing protein [Massilia sp. Leaf139]KQQ87398.1 hypothetical protein ASF77_17690 [Massilia sp. Leaf139]